MQVHYPDFIDARNDLKWVEKVESLTKDENWDELWSVALSTPPIWTVRIVKFLAKKNWRPSEDQVSLFDELSKLVWAFDENDLPGPDPKTPKDAFLENLGKQITTARITADGEFLFVVDGRGLAVEIRKLPELTEVTRLRLDTFGGKSFAPLAIAITEFGDRMCAVLYESKTQNAFLHVYDFDGGELTSEKLLKVELPHLGTQVVRMTLSANAQSAYILSGLNQVCKIDLKTGANLAKFDNVESTGKIEFRKRAFTVESSNSLSDWQKFGRYTMADDAARNLAVSNDEDLLICQRYNEIIVRRASQNYDTERFIESSSAIYSCSSDAAYVVAQDNGSLVLHNLKIQLTKDKKIVGIYRNRPSADFGVGADSVPHITVGRCTDPAARISLSHDRKTLAVAMPNYDQIMIWSLPGGRCMGVIFGLAHEAISELKITSSGAIITVSRAGRVQIWEADYYGHAWTWSLELIQISHHPVSTSSVELLARAKEMRNRGWLTHQEANLLDIALLLFNSRLCLDVEIDWQTELPGDKFDIEID
jgi:hypothetical protein